VRFLLKIWIEILILCSKNVKLNKELAWKKMLNTNFYSPYQFAFFRIIFGIYLIAHFLLLMPYALELSEGSGLISLGNFLPMKAFIAILSMLSLLFTLGISRRSVALLLFLGSCCLINKSFFGPTIALPYVEFILLACAAIPAGEPLSLGQKTFAMGHWKMPGFIYGAAWIFLAVAYGIGGIYRMQNPSWLASQHYIFFNILNWCVIAFELSFVLLCAFSQTRKWAWMAMTLMQVAILLMGIHIDLTLGVLMLHLLVFDARWLRARAFKQHPIVFFDGHCGLCDWFVNFVISEDHKHSLLFSPLQGETAKSKIGTIEIKQLQSVILYDNKKIYRQSDAVLRILGYLGGFWRLLECATILPRGLRDRIYDYVARHRYQWFGQHESCRIPTSEERRFFVP